MSYVDDVIIYSKTLEEPNPQTPTPKPQTPNPKPQKPLLKKKKSWNSKRTN